ncbi:hypothetical protein MFLO_00485 [Listeria floridensis FSL S10-1187]|uniref:Uncharacterized protein n=1 Tax=Listeria floridensis FSL S10-1187 TaxID=1265817 RepID=A0ABP3B160_9LIST|nr:hypothetical protein [Listeria floridensis]EUJ33681.1 hypothetical protein MFLO_00485 [Listeria floridensis FSL S10-1187]
MKDILDYLEQHVEQLVDYWLSSYYVKSNEYEMRKHIDGFMLAQRNETLSLYEAAFENIKKKRSCRSGFRGTW